MMKKNIVVLRITCGVFVALLSAQSNSICQIIANHTIVDDYKKIPQQYIDSVKKMWVVVAGESHSEAYRKGLSSLQADTTYAGNKNYAVIVREWAPPTAYRTTELRVSRLTWGDRYNESGWIQGYGEEDWFTSDSAIIRTKAGITYCNNNLKIGAIGFGWCWDPAIVDLTQFEQYINATRSYIDYCADSIDTKVFFITGTVDRDSGSTGYKKFLGYQSIRDTVAAHPTWILFDYADILCWDDDGTPHTTTWNGYTYPWITTKNWGDKTIGHIGANGALRLGKAMWWMLARIKGWDGVLTGTGVPSNKPNETIPIQIALNQNYPNPFNPNTTISYKLPATNYVTLKVFNLLGKEVATLVNEVQQPGNKSVMFDASALASGIYFYRITARSFTATKKFILLK